VVALILGERFGFLFSRSELRAATGTPCGMDRTGFGWLPPLCLLLCVVSAPMMLQEFARAGVRVPHGFWCTHHHCGGQVTACKSNLKKIAVALEMYSSDNAGRFPTRLVALSSGTSYFKSMPTCPSSGADTYSGSYVSFTQPDTYTVACGGKGHRNVGLTDNYPQYTSTLGLIEK